MHVKNYPVQGIHVISTDSTQNDVKSQLDAGRVESFFILSDHQTHGRGRRGRVWESENLSRSPRASQQGKTSQSQNQNLSQDEVSGQSADKESSQELKAGQGAALNGSDQIQNTPIVSGLLMSFPIQIPPEKHIHIGQISLVVGVALWHVLKNMHVKAQLKWPNDIMMGNQKLAGVLVEMHDDFAVIGVGLNLWRYDGALDRAAFLDDIIPTPPQTKNDRMDLAKMVCQYTYHWMDIWLKEGFNIIRPEWMQHPFNLNHFVELTDGRSGVFHGLSENGDAILK